MECVILAWPSKSKLQYTAFVSVNPSIIAQAKRADLSFLEPPPVGMFR
jgi:hypothetical protein